MKIKRTFTLIILFSVFACKKNRTCECTYQQTITVNDSFGNVISKTELEPTKSTREYKNVSKQSLNILCASYTNSYTTYNLNNTINTNVNETRCELK